MEQDPAQESLSEHTRLHIMYENVARWLEVNTPLCSNSTEPLDTYEGLSLSTAEIADYTYEVHGAVLCDIAPQAAETLCISEGDAVKFTYVPLQFSRDELSMDPELAPAFFTVAISDVANLRCDVELSFWPDDKKLDWQSERTDQKTMTNDELSAFETLILRLDAMFAEMQARGLEPEDLEAYRRELAVARDVATLIEAAEIVATAAAEERFNTIPTQGTVSGQTLYRLQYGDTRSSLTFSNVARNEVEQLRTHIANTMLGAQVALYTFDKEVVRKISPTFHEAERASRTTVTAVTLSARASEQGPVFVYTVTKDVVLKDGVHREEIDSFLLQGARYIRLLTLYEVVNHRPVTVQVDDKQPMKRSQYRLFTDLTSLVEGSSP